MHQWFLARRAQLCFEPTSVPIFSICSVKELLLSSACCHALQDTLDLTRERLRSANAHQAQADGQIASLRRLVIYYQQVAKSSLVVHQLGEELVEEVKQVVAGAKAAKDAGHKAECDKIMRLVKLKWHPGMALDVPAFARPHLSCDLFVNSDGTQVCPS